MSLKHLKNIRESIVGNYSKLPIKKILIFLIAIFFLVSVFSIFFHDRVSYNSYLGNVNLGGVKSAKSREIIKKTLEDYQDKHATFVFDDKIVEIKFTDLGVSFDLDATSEQLKFQAQSRNPFENLASFLISIFQVTKVTPVYSFNAAKFEEFISREFANFEVMPEDARFIESGGKIIVASSKNGELINRVTAASQLADRLDSLSEIPIEIVRVSTLPVVETTKLNELLEKYNSLFKKKIVLSWEYDTWRLEGDDLFSVLKVGDPHYLNGYFYEVKSSDHSIRLVKAKLLSENEGAAEILLSDAAVDSFLKKISKVVDRPTVNATAKFDGSKVTEFTPALDGRKLDVDKTKEEIISAINSQEEKELSTFVIKLPILTTVAKIANDQINSLGIKELIGRGISYFSGSIPNRIYNIELGASRVNGTLVAPGEVFSFNSAVGEVSGKTGYRQAYVISSGRTVLDDGGGICQVSTTIFRAALNSGLDIVSRTAHAYRVGYYEQGGFGPGLDATVFAPSVDFKFKNDTEHHVLIQLVVNRSRAMLEVDIYGTRDGRIVEQDKPVVSNRTPAPAEIRQDDPSLPKGTVKQVDFAAEGASVYFKRRVFKNQQILHDDTFSSKFRPWQAIFLVGTGG